MKGKRTGIDGKIRRILGRDPRKTSELVLALHKLGVHPKDSILEEFRPRGYKPPQIRDALLVMKMAGGPPKSLEEFNSVWDRIVKMEKKGKIKRTWGKRRFKEISEYSRLKIAYLAGVPGASTEYWRMANKRIYLDPVVRHLGRKPKDLDEFITTLRRLGIKARRYTLTKIAASLGIKVPKSEVSRVYKERYINRHASRITQALGKRPKTISEFLKGVKKARLDHLSPKTLTWIAQIMKIKNAEKEIYTRIIRKALGGRNPRNMEELLNGLIAAGLERTDIATIVRVANYFKLEGVPSYPEWWRIDRKMKNAVKVYKSLVKEGKIDPFWPYSNEEIKLGLDIYVNKHLAELSREELKKKLREMNALDDWIDDLVRKARARGD